MPWSITIALYAHVKTAIGAIPEAHWTPIAYPVGGEAHVAETTIVAGRRGNKRKIRVVVRRTRLTDETQGELWPRWRYHAFINNRTDLDPIAADKYHRQHATSNWPSATSRRAPAWRTCPRGASPPTPPG